MTAPGEIKWRAEVPLFEWRELVLWISGMILLGLMPLGMIAALDGLSSGGGTAWRSVLAVAPFVGAVVGLCVALFLGLVFGVFRNRRVANYTVNADGVSIVYSPLSTEHMGYWIGRMMSFAGPYRGRKFMSWKRVQRWESDIATWRIRLETMDFGVVWLVASQAVFTDVMGAMEYWLHNDGL